METNPKLTPQDMEIIEEYFLNGFNKAQAYKKFRPNHVSKNSLYSCSSGFWNRPEVKEYVNTRQNEIIGTREEVINELLVNLKEQVFEAEVGSEYTYQNRQKDIELMMKISGIDKAPKYKEDIKHRIEFESIVINIVDDNEPGEAYE